MTHVDVNAIVKKDGFNEGFEKERETYVINEDKVCDELEEVLKKGGCIVDTHALVDFFPERWFDLVIVLQTDNTVLYDRLIQRGYSIDKVQENVQCEIMKIIAEEGKLTFHRTMSFDSLLNSTYKLRPKHCSISAE